MKILKRFNWRKRGVEINDFLNNDEFAKQREELKNSRLFYVVRANSEKVFKIGISGMYDGKAIGRLREYQLYYGDADDKNKCSGAKIHFLGKTEYNPDVLQKNSEIYKRELFIKRYLKNNDALDRGRERTSADIESLKRIMGLYDDGPDTKTDKRRSTRSSRGIVKLYKPEPTAKDVPESYVRRFITKDFDGRVHLGQIESVGPGLGGEDGTDNAKNDKQIYANVRYDDGDVEQLDFKQVERHVLSDLELQFRKPQLMSLLNDNRMLGTNDLLDDLPIDYLTDVL